MTDVVNSAALHVLYLKRPRFEARCFSFETGVSMISILSNVALIAVALCLFLHYFGEIFLPGASSFRHMTADLVKPTMITAGVLLVCKFVMPSRTR